jgi:hypothetical protein
MSKKSHNPNQKKSSKATGKESFYQRARKRKRRVIQLLVLLSKTRKVKTTHLMRC